MINKILTTLTLLCTALFLKAGIITVTNTNDSGAGSLRQAITDAADGDFISIDAAGTITLTTEFPIITKAITITGNSGGTVISGDNNCRIFTIQITTGTVTLNRLNLMDGYSNIGAAAGVYAITGNNGKVVMNNCTFSGCTTVASEAYGGAIATSADMSLTNCTIYGNTAEVSGGALATLSYCTVNLLNCTIFSNDATSSSGTGGLDITGGAIVSIQNSILAGNTADGGTSYSDFLISGSGTLKSLGNNLSNTVPFAESTDLTGKDLTSEIQLSVLALNASSGMYVCAIQDGSVAINQANRSAAPTLDQCGQIRFGNPDIGAFESQKPIAAKVITQSASKIGSTNAIANGNVIDLGFPFPTAYGVCYGTTSNPDISGSKTDKGAASATGAFTTQLKGLTAGTTYYVRAFATNTAGTSYGDEVSFTTSALLTEPGNALSFDGTNDYVAVPFTQTSLSTFTIETWINPATIPATGDVAIFNTNAWSTTSGGIHFQFEGGYVVLSVIELGSNWPAMSTKLATNTWQHIAVTYDVPNNQVRFYLNGVLNNSISRTLYPTKLNAAELGAWNTSRYFNGKLDEFRVWNTVRTPVEIQADMDNAINTSSAGLLVYYNFNEGIAGEDNTSGSNILPDLTSNGCNGTITNFALAGINSNWVESYAMVVPTSTAATNISGTGFTANWTAPELGTVDNYLLEVATDASFSGRIIGYTPKSLPADSRSETLTELIPGTTYYYRLRADKTSVTGEGAYSNTIMVNEPLIAPTVITKEATSVTTTSATLNGTINANNASTAVTFQYGLTTSYGTIVTATPSPVTGTLATTVSYTLSGLAPNATYHYRVVGVNTAGTANGLDLTFTTLSDISVDLTVSDSILTEGIEACFDAQNEISVGGSSTVTVANNASASFIAGVSIRFLPGFHAEAGSYVHGWITEDGSFCDVMVAEGSVLAASTEKSQIVNELPELPETITDEKRIKVYPNPNNGQFILEMENVENEASVFIYNIQGAVVFQSVSDVESVLKINLPGMSKGVYFVKVNDKEKLLTKKIMVN